MATVLYFRQTEPSRRKTEHTVEVNTGYEAANLARDYYADHSTTRYDLLRTGMHPFSADRGGNQALVRALLYAATVLQLEAILLHDECVEGVADSDA